MLGLIYHLPTSSAAAMPPSRVISIVISMPLTVTSVRIEPPCAYDRLRSQSCCLIRTDLSGCAAKSYSENDYPAIRATGRVEMQLGSLVQHRFVSHLTGRIKPDADAFTHVLGSLGCPASAVLFLDDNRMNVAAAESL